MLIIIFGARPVRIFLSFIFLLFLNGCAQPEVICALPKLIGFNKGRVFTFSEGRSYTFNASKGATFDGYMRSGFRMSTAYKVSDHLEVINYARRAGVDITVETRNRISGPEIVYLVNEQSGSDQANLLILQKKRPKSTCFFRLNSYFQGQN